MKASQRDHRVYLHDILTAIQRIHEHTPNGEDDFVHSGVVQDAVLRQISIIGEATSKLPVALRAARPDLPWKQVIGMRNVVMARPKKLPTPPLLLDASEKGSKMPARLERRMTPASAPSRAPLFGNAGPAFVLIPLYSVTCTARRGFYI